MSTIRDLIQGRKVHSLHASESVMTAALYMTQCNIGAIPVMDGERLAGVFSERDILTRVVAAKRDPEATLLREVMTSEPFIVGPDDPVERCLIAFRYAKAKNSSDSSRCGTFCCTIWTKKKWTFA
jgi:CBS domain-containing protein